MIIHTTNVLTTTLLNIFLTMQKFLYMKAIYILLRLYCIDTFCIQLYKCKYYEFCINDTKNAFLKAQKHSLMHLLLPHFISFSLRHSRNITFAKLLLRGIGDNDLVRDFDSNTVSELKCFCCFIWIFYLKPLKLNNSDTLISRYYLM